MRVSFGSSLEDARKASLRYVLSTFGTALLGVVSACGSDGAAGSWGDPGASSLGAVDSTTEALELHVLPLELSDVLDLPATMLRPATGGGEVLLSDGPSSATFTLEGVAAETFDLVTIVGGSRGNRVINSAAGSAASPVRLIVAAGSTALELEDSNLLVSGEDGQEHAIYLPALDLDPAEQKAFWVAEDGSTFAADVAATEPDFSLPERSRVPWALGPDMKANVVARGFDLPVALAFLPHPGAGADDPLYYVVELRGAIQVVRQNGLVSEYASGLLNFEPVGVSIETQQGATCAVVDPASGDLFVGVAFADQPELDPTPRSAAVERFSSNDGGLTFATRERIRSLEPSTPTSSLTITNLTFGPDGLLYVGVVGDLGPTTGSDLGEFGGKVLRMTRDGAAVEANPYYNSEDGITAREFVYASGLRNVRGAAWRLSDGAAYFVERGTRIDRFARLGFGSNYGWDGTDSSMRSFALYGWDPARAATSLAFVQPQTLGGSGFPAEYQGRAYVTQSAGTGHGDPEHKSITEWSIGSDGALASGPRSVAYYEGSGAVTPVAVAAGPDGLYFSELYPEDAADARGLGANIVRLSHRAPALPVDCNHNGTPDTEDLESGASLDCNLQREPDECDIASGRSVDCNLDGVPDECDATQALRLEFGTGPDSFALGGTARWVDGALELTPARLGAEGIAVRPPLSNRPVHGLDVQFDFRIGGDSGGEGTTFVVFDDTRYPDGPILGEPGQGALVIGLDTHDIDATRGNRVNVSLDGQLLGSYQPTFDMEDDRFHTLRFSFDGAFLSLALSSTPGVFETAFHALEVPGFVPFVASYAFAARTSVSSGQHRIDNVVFWVATAHDANGDRIPDLCQCVADVDDGLGSGHHDLLVTDADLNYFLTEFRAAVISADIDDGSGTGQPDGAVTILDLRYFLQRWNAGC